MNTPHPIITCQFPTPLGEMLAAATLQGVCLLEFADPQRLELQLAGLQRQYSEPIIAGTSRVLQQLQEELSEYFAGSLHQFTVPLLYPGTDFQQRVWEQLFAIPYGETRSYADLAQALDSPGAARAVGHANGQNRLAIMIPCHRVIQKDGGLGGYAGGLWRKRLLLDLEQKGFLPLV